MSRQLIIMFGLAHVILILNMHEFVQGQPQNQQEKANCYFIFGDSFSANGNDNGLDTFKSNYLPYGIDFPDGPTGRFSNGRIMADIIAEKVGIKDYIRPYRTVGTKVEMLKGVNYASSGSLLQSDIAGSRINSISLGQQLRYHKKIVRRIGNILGNKNITKQYLNNCLYSVEIGSNDFVFNNYIPNNDACQATPRQPANQFAQYLVNHFFFSRLTNLYHSGARKVVVFGLPPLGCSPAAIRMYSNNHNDNKCISVINTDISVYNNKLRSMVYKLNKYLKNSQFTFIDSFNITTSKGYSGFKNTKEACCETDYEGMCYTSGKSCSSKKEYFYWDGYRSTEAANIVLANAAFDASVPSQAYPFNIHQLISKNYI